MRGIFLPVPVFFAPLCSPCPLRCSAQALGFVFLGFVFALVCFGLVWGVTMHFCAWFFASVFWLCSVFFSFQDPTTAEDEERTPGSGAAQWRGRLEGLLVSSTK